MLLAKLKTQFHGHMLLLEETVIKRKGNKLYVKWKGYDNSFNSLIDKKDIVQNESILS